MNNLIALLKKHEKTGPVSRGRFMPYVDSVGKMTIGWGRNITDNGIDYEEATVMLLHDIADSITQARNEYRWFENLNEARKDVVISMVFNMGIANFGTFKKLHGALSSKDWFKAKVEMLDSLWARQVGPRAVELSNMMLSGKYPR